jgi:hypothetical protein
MQALVIYLFIGIIDDSYILGGVGLAMSFYILFAFALLVGFNAVIIVFTS